MRGRPTCTCVERATVQMGKSAFASPEAIHGGDLQPNSDPATLCTSAIDRKEHWLRKAVQNTCWWADTRRVPQSHSAGSGAACRRSLLPLARADSPRAINENDHGRMGGNGGKGGGEGGGVLASAGGSRGSAAAPRPWRRCRRIATAPLSFVPPPCYHTLPPPASPLWNSRTHTG